MNNGMNKQIYRYRWIPLLVLMCLVGCSALTPTPTPVPDPDEAYTAVFKKYMEHLRSGEYAAMYALLSEESQQSYDEETFTTRSKIYQNIGFTNFTATLDSIAKEEPPEEARYAAGRKLAYSVSFDTAAGAVSFSHFVHVRAYPQAESRAYRIEWGPDLIFPQLGDSDKVRLSVTETGTRGTIYDRSGAVLAGMGPVKSVGIVPGKLGEDRAASVAQIAAALQLPPETIQKKLDASWVKDDHFVPITLLAESDILTKEALLQVPGIRINDATDRVYPLGEAAAHLVGYVQTINQEELEAHAGQGYTSTSRIGKAGLESLYEEKLRAVDGVRLAILDVDGAVKEVLAEQPARDGEDLHTTIDGALQQRLYQQLKEDKGCATVMNPHTGEVLALLSTPAYDPNRFVLGLPNALWEEWRDSERKPLYNRFKASMVPGSVFKPITAAIGLHSGAFTADENFGYTGRSWQKDTSWGNYNITTLQDYGENVVLKNALIYSDNIYFARAALKLGAEGFAQGLNRVGFGQKLPFAFGLSASTYGKDGAFGSDIDLADSGYGQGRVLVNPLHLASLYSAFVNEGNMILPYLELKPENSGKVWIENAFDAEVARTIRDDLVEVVENPKGTAHSARVEGQRLGGKTGTAEIKASKEDTTGTELGWYATFSADPDALRPLLFIGMVEDVKDRGGSHYVLPIGKSVFTQ